MGDARDWCGVLFVRIGIFRIGTILGRGLRLLMPVSISGTVISFDASLRVFRVSTDWL